METVIAACTCEHAYQDRVYGKGRRVKKLSKDGKPVCTVCLR
jgi:hypothetical protein